MGRGGAADGEEIVAFQELLLVGMLRQRKRGTRTNMVHVQASNTCWFSSGKVDGECRRSKWGV